MANRGVIFADALFRGINFLSAQQKTTISNKQQAQERETTSPEEKKGNLTVEEYDKMAEDVNANRTRKPGSQINPDTTRNNNGRGGGR